METQPKCPAVRGEMWQFLQETSLTSHVHMKTDAWIPHSHAWVLTPTTPSVSFSACRLLSQVHLVSSWHCCNIWFLQSIGFRGTAKYHIHKAWPFKSTLMNKNEIKCQIELLSPTGHVWSVQLPYLNSVWHGCDTSEVTFLDREGAGHSIIEEGSLG